MSQFNLTFQDTELKEIDQANDLKISPFREDGKTYGTPTWIWAIVVEGELYVRAYHGKNSRWYKAAMEQKAGKIHAAGMQKEVTFESVIDPDINHLVDEAYKKKYADSPYLSPMISDQAKSATVKIIPK